jgi:hypothetical protein
MRKIITLLLVATYLCGSSQVSRFYKDGQWWVSWDRKDADVQIFRPAKNDSVTSMWLSPTTTTDTTFVTKGTFNKPTLSDYRLSDYRAKCRGRQFSLISDSMYNASSNSYLITFKDGTSIQSTVQCYTNGVYIPPPPWTNDRSLFADHLMFRVMAACYDDKWLYCPCGSKFPLVKK